MLSLEDGKTLVRFARSAIESYLKGDQIPTVQNLPKSLMAPCGVFVTLNSIHGTEKQLRGCIGFPYPQKPLAEAVISSAISAATEDPRFPPVRLSEMGSLVIEVTVLTVPELIRVNTSDEYPEKIKIGRDGLIIEKGYNKGLLLPQVPVEQGWDTTMFLSWACRKAGLPLTAWLDPKTKIYSFQGIIFEEKSPNGDIVRRQMSEGSC
ncbi:MAG: TIGR00296 family protein [Candidatus Ranarchaeia archaeon]